MSDIEKSGVLDDPRHSYYSDVEVRSSLYTDQIVFDSAYVY